MRAEAVSAAQDATREAEARLARTQAAQSEAAAAVARLERKVALLSKERDGLKSILASYDEEEAGLGASLLIPLLSNPLSNCSAATAACRNSWMRPARPSSMQSHFCAQRVLMGHSTRRVHDCGNRGGLLCRCWRQLSAQRAREGAGSDERRAEGAAAGDGGGSCAARGGAARGDREAGGGH